MPLQTAHLKKLTTQLKNYPVILTAHDELQRTSDMAYLFAQENSFLWLTGINEAGWLAVVVDGELTLVAPERDETKVLFEGGLTKEQAIELSSADKVLSKHEGDELLNDLSQHYDSAYTLGTDPHAGYHSFVENPALKNLRKKLEGLFKTVEDCRTEFNKARAIKNELEVASLQRAVDVSVQAFEKAKAELPLLNYEYELEAIFNSEFRRTGAGGHAYEPIVAGGKNACTLHYGKNNDPLPGNGLVLIDAGAKVDGYAADITRTWSMGMPTQRQVEVHAAVESAHKQIIKIIKPGLKFSEYQKSVDTIMKDALQKIGLLESHEDEITYRTYFPHAISHGLGLDVHESLGGFGEFKPGMIFTIEPGIYIPKEGIGVRIEDNILVTEDGHKNLSADLSTSL